MQNLSTNKKVRLLPLRHWMQLRGIRCESLHCCLKPGQFVSIQCLCAVILASSDFQQLHLHLDVYICGLNPFRNTSTE